MMAKKNKHSGKLAVGIFLEGSCLHVACLSQKGKKIRLVSAEILQLIRNLETVVESEIVSEVSNILSDDPVQLNIPQEPPDEDVLLMESENNLDDNTTLLVNALNRLPGKKYKLAISLAEPNVYYSCFSIDRELKGQKLKRKIIEELSKEKVNMETLPPDSIHLQKLANGRLMAVVRDSDGGILNILTAMKDYDGKRMPVIAFIESAETSLVNLVKEHYKFQEGEISAVIYVGYDYSRLIFMQGNEIFNISHIIGAGLDSENIANTIYSRLLLEEDNLNLPQLNNIILTGEAFDAGLEEFLVSKLPEKINIEYIRFDKLGIVGIEPLLARFAVAIGAALRILDRKNESLYAVDLTPGDIKEGQKKFKLGIVGWLLLFLIPLLTFFTTIKVIQEESKLDQLKVQLRANQAELAHLQEMELRLNLPKNKLQKYDKALSVLDSMPVNSWKWSEFLHKLASISQKIGLIWVTDISPTAKDRVLLKGYSIYRNRIPRFSKALGDAMLNKVEVQEIRGRRVYNFEIELILSER